MGSLPTRRVHTEAAVLSAVVAAGALLRVLGATGTLWLDEIWTRQLVEQLPSPWAVFVMHHDNNHYLNSIWQWFIPHGCSPLVYRAPAIVCGVVSVALAWAVARAWGRLEGLLAAGLVAASYFLVHYTSEARGYGLLICFSLACFLAQRRLLEFTVATSRRSRYCWASCFAVCGCGGFLAHPTFIHFFAAAGCWAMLSRPQPTREWWRDPPLAISFATPALLAAMLYWLDLRHLTIGGGPPASQLATLIAAASLAGGGATSGWPACWAAVTLAALAAAGMIALRFGRHHDWLGALLIGAAPIMHVVLVNPAFLFPRYFVLTVLFGLIVSAAGLAWLLRAGRWPALAAVMAIAVFLGGSLTHAARLTLIGRGDYLPALEWIAARDPSPTIAVTSDHNHGNRMLVEHFARRVAGPQVFTYVDCDHWPDPPPRWLILHEPVAGADRVMPPRIDAAGRCFAWRRRFDCYLLSGWRWHVYELLPRSAAATVATTEPLQPVAATAATTSVSLANLAEPRDDIRFVRRGPRGRT